MIFLLLWQTERFNEEWLRLLVPPLQIKTGLDPDFRRRVLKKIVFESAPSWIPKFITGSLSSFFVSENSTKKLLNSAMKAIKKMSDAGIPIVMGSDAGNWPVWTTFYHGYASTREMELLEKAGLPPSRIITSATSLAAKMLGEDSIIGTIEEGKVADLVLLNKDPFRDGMQAFRDIAYVIKNGRAKSPTDWLSGR